MNEDQIGYIPVNSLPDDKPRIVTKYTPNSAEKLESISLIVEAEMLRRHEGEYWKLLQSWENPAKEALRFLFMPKMNDSKFDTPEACEKCGLGNSELCTTCENIKP